MQDCLSRLFRFTRLLPVVIALKSCGSSDSRVVCGMTFAQFSGTPREVRAEPTGLNNCDLDAEWCYFARLECPANSVPGGMRQAGMVDPPSKTEPKAIGDFGLRGSVRARFTGKFAVNVTQVMVSSKRLETGALVRSLPAAAVRREYGKPGALSKAGLSSSFPPLHTAANSAGARSASAEGRWWL